MKNLLYFSLLVLGIFLVSGCNLFDNEEFEILDPVTLPEPAASFIQTNFPDFQIQRLDDEDLCDNTSVIEVELEDGPGPDVDLYFTPDGEFLFSATEIMIADLPQAVLNTIDTDFADYVIDMESAERFDFPDGSVQYNVELIGTDDDDYDLVLAEDGTVVCWEEDYPDDDDDDDDDDENDGNDNDGDGANVTLPDSIRAFINSEYANYRIDEIERDDLCDDLYYFVVELEDGPGPDIDLYFSLDWAYEFSATDIEIMDIPVSVSNAVANDYPDYQIDPDDVERLDYSDNSVAYLLEIESADDDLEVLYNTEGMLQCEERSDDDDDDDDDGDDDNDDNDNNASLPDSIRAFINSEYADYRIDGVEREDLCDDQDYFKVELEDGQNSDIDLYFDLNWQLSFTAIEITASELPTTVTDAVATDFPGSQINDDDIERLDFPDGSVQFYFEIEATDDDDYDLIYTSAGVLVCSDRS